MDVHQLYEKLGMFYLGREVGLDTGESSEGPLLLKSRDLTTHGIIIGMTGSGKTGLGIAMIEEAIMDGVPSIVVDPKGDMANLLLTFPELDGRDFSRWADPAEAAAAGQTAEEYGATLAERWRKGLSDWGQGKERIAALKNNSSITVYTPGGSAGVGISVLSGLEPPGEETRADGDTLINLVNATTSGLLSLVQISGEPSQSREHILISSILLKAWQENRTLDMEGLIGAVVSPPFEKVGVFALNTFYPQAERMQLAMKFNNILASPAFSAWLKGEPLDIQRLLYSEDGRPQTAIISIAHLSEAERMFFITMLLNRFVGWMRGLSGASSLRALLYMDEIYGYFPPSANPPSKKPMLLLLKQARAFGCGVVLATQNPVDLDYKGLANIGTWFVGRLQTSQDRAKVAEGIAGASGGRLTEKEVNLLLAKLESRRFLLSSAHLEKPALFASRWVMSFLKGPMSAADISRLMDPVKANEQDRENVPVQVNVEVAADHGTGQTTAPILSDQIEQLYYLRGSLPEETVLSPWLAGTCSLRFFHSGRGIDQVETVQLKLFLDENFSRSEWEDGQSFDYTFSDCFGSAPEGYRFGAVPVEISQLKNFRAQQKSFADYLYHNRRLTLFRCRAVGLESRPQETEGEFKARIADALREKRDEALTRLRKKYSTRQQRLERQHDRALQRLDKEEADVRSKTSDTLISVGVAVLGAFLGRKAISTSTITRAARGVRSAGRVSREKDDVRRATEEIERLESELETLASELSAEVEQLSEKFDPENALLENVVIKPRRNDIFDIRLALVWEPADQ